jgi:hypothetical protein
VRAEITAGRSKAGRSGSEAGADSRRKFSRSRFQPREIPLKATDVLLLPLVELLLGDVWSKKELVIRQRTLVSAQQLQIRTYRGSRRLVGRQLLLPLLGIRLGGTAQMQCCCGKQSKRERWPIDGFHNLFLVATRRHLNSVLGTAAVASSNCKSGRWRIFELPVCSTTLRVVDSRVGDTCYLAVTVPLCVCACRRCPGYRPTPIQNLSQTRFRNCDPWNVNCRFDPLPIS